MMSNGIVKSEVSFIDHEDKIVHKATQPTEDLILDRNRELRKNEGAIRDLQDGEGRTWGRQVANIPYITLDWAVRNGFDIYSKDSKHAEKELFRFLQTTPQGQACLIREKI